MKEDDGQSVFQAAEPILASAIWAGQHAAVSVDVSQEKPTMKGRKLATSHKSIDAALYGGLDYGSICCISSDLASGVTELAESLLISHLLDSSISLLGKSDSTAIYIDAAQMFDVRRLHRKLMATLETRGKTGLDDIPKEAMAALDRLNIMKVFDFVGLTESISEVRDGLEGYSSGAGISAAGPGTTNEPPTLPRGTINDSQDDEGEDLVSSHELLDPRPMITQFHNTISLNCGSNVTLADPFSTPNHVIIIDNLPTIFAPLLKTNFAHGNALLTTFLRSLAHLTRVHGICTIVLNRTSSSSTSTLVYGRSKAQNRKDESVNNPSIFTSCKLRPALGMALAYSIDVHLLVHRVPGRREDAKIVHGQVQGELQTNGEMMSVLEVLQDRQDRRVGRWAPFTFDADGRLLEILL